VTSEDPFVTIDGATESADKFLC